MKGITCKRMDCSGLWCSGTTYITFEDVKVPVENIIGKENQGFKFIMYNFNIERWGIIIKGLRMSRVCFEEAYNYSHKRKTFNNRLVDNQIIRAKLGNMARQIESTYNWLESVTYQLNVLPHEISRDALASPISLLKVQTSQCLDYCAKEAVQIFGGLGFTRGGQGEKVERIYRETRAVAIFGGSEEIMLDFAVKRIIKSKL